MKLYNKILSSSLFLALGTVLFSCDNNDFEYTPADFPEGDQVYFPSTAATSYTLNTDASSFSIPLMRGSSDGPITVPVTATCTTDNVAADAFSFPSSITFNQGETKASYVVQYDAELIEFDQQYSFTLKIDERSTFDYGTPDLDITVQIPSPWTTLGRGTYEDAFWGVSASSDIAAVTFQQNDLDKNLFRISNPYVALNGESTYFEFRLLQPGDVFYGQTVSQTGLVGFTDYFIENYDYYGDDLYILFPGRFTSLADPSNWVYNYVAAYQDNGLPGEIHLSPYYYMFNTGGWNYTTAETITIVFPGYVVLDYSASVFYKGMFTNPDNTIEIVANVALGSDATSARVAIVEGTDADSAVSGIEDGSIDYVTVTSSGDVNIPFESGNPTGRYTIVVVTYDGSEAKETASVVFNYTSSSYDPNKGWTSLGYAEYTDGYMCSIFDIDALTWPVEIQENQETPGFYRLVNPYGESYPYNDPGDWDPAVNSYLYIHAENPETVYIGESESTTDWGYGEITYYSLAGYYIEYGGKTVEEMAEAGYCGNLTDGIITMPALSLYWFMGSYQGDANYLYDEDADGATGGEVYWKTNADGEAIAPFCVDMSSMVNGVSATAKSSRSASVSKTFNFKKTARQFALSVRNKLKQREFKPDEPTKERIL